MNLTEVAIGQEYIVKEIDTDDQELNAFLFSLGLYSGESVTVISRKKKLCFISIKDSRYCIDGALAGSIEVFE